MRDPELRVMLVDDQQDVRFLMRTLLADAEALEVVAEAASGEEALSRIAEVDPDVLVLDAMMPGLDGLETTARVLADRPAQLIVLCSAAFDPGVWERARAAGVAASVSKDDLFGLPDVVRGLRPGS